MLQHAFELIRDLGFPTFVCLWLMWRAEHNDKMEELVKKLSDRVNKLTRINAVLIKTLDTKSLEGDDISEIRRLEDTKP